MKKIKYLLYIFCFFYIFLFIDCYASLTKIQADDIAAFAENMINKSNNEHKDKNGLPLIAYSQEHRIDGMQGKLSYFTRDVQRINTINANKWAFDCASFAAYVYNYTLGIYTYIQKGSIRPYTVGYFVNNANHNVDFSYVMQGVKVPDIDFNKLQKGDLIIFVGEHIMIYVGDGKIAHVSATAVKKMEV